MTTSKHHDGLVVADTSPDQVYITTEGARPRALAKVMHAAEDGPGNLARMVAVAQACPKTRFLCFTKQYATVVVHRRLCKPWAPNLNIVVSAWPGLPIPVELRSFPTAWMRDRKNPDPRIPADAVECDGGCDTCGLCWMLEPGRSVVFDKH